MLGKEAKAIGSITEQHNHLSRNENVAVSFSGGKDSLVVLDLAVRAGVKKAVYCSTTADFDETIPYIKKVKEFYGIDLAITRSRLDFFELIENIGLPSRRARWCCDVFKFAPIAKYGKNLGIKMFITGLRRDESFRRKTYSIMDQNPILPFVQFNPILEWTNDDIWEYIHSYDLPYHPLYDMGFDRIGCWCCPYKTNEEWELVEKLFPEKISFLERILEKRAAKMKIRDKKRFVKEHGWTSWISPVRRISVGKIKSCQNNKMADIDVNYIEFDGKKDTNIKKVSRLLPVLTDLFWITDNGQIKVILDKTKRKKLDILIEKAINCVSCGVCTSLCPTGALMVDDLSVYVDTSICTNCGLCLNASSGLLRGACIARNYSNRPATLIDLRE